MLPSADLEYDLPESLIATAPAEPRDSARLLVVRRADPGVLEHRAVRDLPDYVTAGDTLVLNRTRVVRARLEGEREDTGGRVEGLWLGDADGPSGTWRVMLRSNGRLREGAVVRLTGRSPGAEARITLRRREGDHWVVSVDPEDADLERIGRTPIPPYILRARRARGEAGDDDLDRRRYQTVYASEVEGRGSVAAPTAGLHLTDELLGRLTAAGVRRTEVELSVGVGTFAPITTELVERHPMHPEWCSAPGEAVRAVIETPGRVIAVGTTSARTLESVPDPLGGWVEDGWSGDTRLLITPGYRWRVVDGLLTNFHLPRSTLLAMVGALLPGGVGRLLAIYHEAIDRGYRFYSYGDAMLILP